MGTLIFLFLIFNTILVRCDDNVAMESNVNYQDAYKVHPEVEDENFEQDNQLKEVQQGNENHFQINVENFKYADDGRYRGGVKYSHIAHGNHELKHHVNELQPNQHLVYTNQQQQIYLQHPHQQVRIHGAEASHLHQINEQEGHQKATGFSSYVEHISDKENEEIKSALKEHTGNDLKRLVPKSGISFKIYHNNKNTHSTSQKTQSDTHNYLHTSSQGAIGTSQYSKLHHNLKVEAPLNTHTLNEYQQSTIDSHVDNLVSQNQQVKNIQQSYQLSGQGHESQKVGLQHGQYGQLDVNSASQAVSSHTAELSDKSSSYVEPNYKFKIKHGEHSKATSHIEYNQGPKKYVSKEGYRKEVIKTQYKKPSYIGGDLKTASVDFQKGLKEGVGVQYQAEGHGQAGGVKVSQGLSSHLAENSYLEVEGLKNSQNIATHTTAAPYVSIDSGKISQSHGISHSTSAPYVSVDSGKVSQSLSLTHSTAAPYISVNSGKTSQSHLLTHSTPAPYVSIDSGKVSQVHTLSHSTAAPYANIDSGKVVQSHLLTHSTAAPYVNIDSGKISQSHLLTHSTAAPYVNIDSGKLTQSHFLSHSTAAPHVSIDSSKHIQTNFVSHTTASPYHTIESPNNGLSSIATHTTAAPFISSPKPEQYVSHLSTHSYQDSESAKTNQNDFISHFSVNLDSESGKGGQSHFITHVDEGLKQQPHSYISSHLNEDSEKINSLVSHIPTNTYVDTEVKHSPNNFDHQKALEGSTSFDIKNAIGNTEALGHEAVTGFVTPAPVHVETEKQTLLYIVPKTPILPTPAALTHHVSGEQAVKDFGHGGVSSTHEFSYPVGLGKYITQHQTVPIWNTEHFKHGTSLPLGDIHQSLVKLHVPKEELYQNFKTTLEHPTSVVSHTYHHKPVNFHQEIPFFKFAQDIHFQSKKNLHPHKPLLQGGGGGGHLKLVHSAVPDWSFYKTKMPSINLNSVVVKPDLMSIMHEPGKKVIPILVKKRKARGSKDVGVVYGKTKGNRGPVKPQNHRQEKTVRVMYPEASNNVKSLDAKGDRKNEFSVSASYKVDRSFRNSDSS